jgi:hypothetical protein
LCIRKNNLGSKDFLIYRVSLKTLIFFLQITKLNLVNSSKRGNDH